MAANPQTQISKRDKLYVPRIADRCACGDCPTRPTVRLYVKQKGKTRNPHIDVCAMHLRSLTKHAKEGSFSTTDLSYIRQSIEEEGK